MLILVTGAAGFIGSHLAERLVEVGHSVRGIDCLSDYYARELKLMNVAALQAKGVEILRLDLASDVLTTGVAGVDMVFHLAAQPGISATTSFETYVRNNITATHRLLQALEGEHSFRGFINIATSSIYGRDATYAEDRVPEPASYYGVTKLAAEQLVLAAGRDKGLPACSLRLFSVYGPRERPDKLYPRLITAALESRPFPLYEGSEHHLRSFTYVDDIVDGFLASMDSLEACRGEVINIGTDTAITTGEGIRIVEEIVGRPVQVEPRPKRPGDQLRTHANIAKARQLLGYDPQTTPRTGIAKTVDWYREHIVGKYQLWS
jgi:UDP-glucuronate 4-epimerase